MSAKQQYLAEYCLARDVRFFDFSPGHCCVLPPKSPNPAPAGGLMVRFHPHYYGGPYGSKQDQILLLIPKVGKYKGFCVYRTW